MSAAEETLNVTIAQIEDALLGGQTVPDFAREWSEPPANVLAVFRRLQREGRIPSNAPAQIATPAVRSLASVPTQNPAPSVDALLNAAARSASKRTQALGVKLADLATVIRTRLADEKKAAEQDDYLRVQREKAAEDVKRLEEELRRAKARMRKPRANSGRTPTATANARQAAYGEFPCDNGCGKVATTKAGQRAHERFCKGGAA